MVVEGEAGTGRGSNLPDSGFTDHLVASNITVRFGGVTAIDDVSLSFRVGEIVGLIGPNGAGKTTLVNTVTGFQPPAAGRVTLDDENLTDASPQRRARMGLARTFQGTRLFDGMSVAENVQVSYVAQGASRRSATRQAGEVLASLGLEGLAERPAADLSTGQERRLQVARAVAMRPRYLFLDEPAAGLNEAESAGLTEVIRGLPDSIGCGVVLIEHDMQVIMGVCGRIAVLDSGRLIADGTPAEVRNDQAVIDAYLGS